jgi:hypothetical protein
VRTPVSSKNRLRAVFRLTACTVVGITGLSFLTSSIAAAAALNFGTPTEVAGTPGGSGQLKNVSCTDASDCTAVGFTNGGQPIYATESAGTWGAVTEVSGSAGGGGYFYGVSCTGASDCVAVGFDANSQPIYDQDSNGTWGTPTEVPGGGVLDSVSCTSATACTAVGSDSNSQPAYATESGGIWGSATEVPGATGGGQFEGVSCPSAANCTAVGLDNDGDPIYATESAGVWSPATVVTSAPGGSGRYYKVSCTDATDCTAVGIDGNSQPIYVTESAGTWETPTEVSGVSGAGAYLYGVSCTSSTACTAVGYDFSNNNPPIYVNESGGIWGQATEIPGSPGGGGQLHSVSCTTANECTAVGTDNNELPFYATAAPAASESTTTVNVTGSSALGGGVLSDSLTVTGSAGGPTPSNSADGIDFYLCQISTSSTYQPGLCPATGTPFDSTENLSGSGSSATATSNSFTPTSAGTWCFSATYSGDFNYVGSSDNVTGIADPNECALVTTASSSSVSTPSSSSASLGGPNADNVVVTGNDSGATAPYPTGTVTFYTCAEGVDPCTPANWAQLGSPVTLGTGSANTNMANSVAFDNTAAGTWCFASVYSGDSNYSGSTDSTSDECYTVSKDTSSTLSSPLQATINQAQPDTDQSTVTGGASGPAPTGTVTFFECGPTQAPTACSSGSQVGSPVNLTASGANTATANSAPFTPTASPTSIGYWCFRAVYSGDANYTSSADGSTGECFYVTGPLLITTASPLPKGTLHVKYAVQLQAAGGTAPYTWKSEGKLPSWLHLSSSGLLSGKPTSAGTFTFKVKVHDSSSPTQEKASKSFTLVIKR